MLGLTGWESINAMAYATRHLHLRPHTTENEKYILYLAPLTNPNKCAQKYIEKYI